MFLGHGKRPHEAVDHALDLPTGRCRRLGLLLLFLLFHRLLNGKVIRKFAKAQRKRESRHKPRPGHGQEFSVRADAKTDPGSEHGLRE